MKSRLKPGRHQESALPSRTGALSGEHEPFAFLGFCLLFGVCALSLYSWGCGGRRPVVNQPPPTGPVSTSPDVAGESDRPAGPPLSGSPAGRGKPGGGPVPAGYTEQGNASWYGEPFHGRRSSNGEIYDMYKLTAAHRTLPFETIVRVTNLSNGKATTVRITDRGPFVENRIIDLSLAAARAIELVGAGVGRVKIEVLGTVDPTAGSFTVQVGAFRDRANAERLKERLRADYTPIQIRQVETGEGLFYRVQVGRTGSEEAANRMSAELHNRHGLTSFVVRLDE